MYNKSLIFIILALLSLSSNSVFAKNNTAIKQMECDSILKLDSIKSINEVLSYYEFQRATQKTKYAKTKENVAMLKYLKSLKWKEQEKLEIFKLYKGSYYIGEANDTKTITLEARKEISANTEYHWKKLEEKVLTIAGKNGAKTFWKNFEQITNQFTDITKF